LPFRPFTFERTVAEREGRIGLLRVGHPFVNALEDLVRADDRGAAFAMWRHVPGIGGSPQLFFRFDFMIEADIAGARRLAEPSLTSPEALRRRANEVCPVVYQTVWLDSDLSEVPSGTLLALLSMPYSRENRPDGGKDTNLRLDRWGQFDSVVP